MSTATSSHPPQQPSKDTDSYIGLPRLVLQHVFGPEFVSSLYDTFEHSMASSSTDSTAINEFVHSSAAKSQLLNLQSQEELLASVSHDGPSKPKTPRQSEPSDLIKFSSPTVASDESKPRAPHFFDHLTQQMRAQLDSLEEAERQEMDTVQQEGRLGPKVAKFDVASHVGSFIISTDRLGVSSQCNFGSVRACSCVYKGKWQYEVQLGSNGVMQVGWSTLQTKFSQEKGVGDTIDSYAYDGNRLRKWNKSTAPYGETWQAGDIIGSCIDLDLGTIEFLRNGKSLGVAFTDIRRGPSVAYFPAISLAYQENIVANFGATPLQFPVEGSCPLQKERTADNMKSTLLLSWLEKLLQLYKNNEFNDETPDHQSLLVITNRIMEFLGPHLHSGFVIEQSFYPFLASSILGLPEKICHTDKIVSSNLNYDKVVLLLDIMWTLLEESEMRSCLERMCVVLMNQFRSNSLNIYYPFQQYSLLCLQALVKHRKTRRHFIRNLLLDRSGRIMHFLHVRPMDETVLKVIIPETWWDGKDGTENAAYEEACNLIHQQVTFIQDLQVKLLKVLLTNQDGTEKRPSSRALFLRKFRIHVKDVIRPGSVLHQPIQKAMCTFFCFLKTVSELYAEEVTQENTNESLPDIPSSLFYDTSVAFYDMERLGGLASYLYKTYHKEIASKLAIPDYVPDKPEVPAEEVGQPSASVPGVIHVTTNIGTDDNLITQEVALPLPDILMAAPHPISSPPPPMPPPALVTSIPMRATPRAMPATVVVTPPTETASTTSSTETIAAASPPVPTFGTLFTGTPSGHNMLIPFGIATDFRNMDQGFTFYPGGFVGFATMEHRTTGVQPQNPAVTLLGKDSGSIDSLFSLRELLDDAIIIFNSGVQSNVEKVVSLRTTMEGYEEALKSANTNLISATNVSEKEEILKSIEIFTNKLDEQSRHMAWIKSAVFTKERQMFVYKLLKVVLQTLRSASAEGDLFTFVPEHYISTLINLNSLIINHMHPTVPYSNIPDLSIALSQVAEFVAMHFADSRIVIAEVKDTLTQALSTFICSRQMLTALEEMPKESQLAMIKSILRPYENRAWAQSNWMLVRMWQGDGFAFQYPNSLESRRSYRAKPVQDEFGISTNLPPTSSRIFQNHVANVLLEDQKFAVSYIHSVLNQLNWAFSEFVGLLQEIQTAANRPERVFVEARQLKICCTCFELSYSLLRVLEMIVSISPSVLVDFTRDSSEPLLGRLSMLMSQVLNRIGSNTGSFSNVIELDIPGLENVTHFPVLSAVAGILVSLIRPELGKLENEIPATSTVLGEPSFQVNSLDFFIGRNQSHVPEGRRIFSLRNHVPDDVSEIEMQQLEDVINHLNTWAERLQPALEVIDDDEICTICYAYPKNATLKPCNHRTCKSCILHHLMNRGECFFCKAVIQQVFLDDNTKIYDMNP